METVPAAPEDADGSPVVSFAESLGFLLSVACIMLVKVLPGLEDVYGASSEVSTVEQMGGLSWMDWGMCGNY